MSDKRRRVVTTALNNRLATFGAGSEVQTLQPHEALALAQATLTDQWRVLGTLLEWQCTNRRQRTARNRAVAGITAELEQHAYCWKQRPSQTSPGIRRWPERELGDASEFAVPTPRSLHYYLRMERTGLVVAVASIGVALAGRRPSGEGAQIAYSLDRIARRFAAALEGLGANADA